MANELTKIPKFRRCVLQNFPFIEQDFDALTDYQLLCKVVEYLNKVISSQNEVIEIAESLTAAFNELQSFVENYFDNLDVQEEINNKLDQMVEDGVLQEIITTYIQSNVAWTFNTVADMKLATNLVAGSFAQTLGFHNINDGGGALYKISDTGTANEIDVIAIGSLYATIVSAKEINIKQLGAYGDDAHDESSVLDIALNNYDEVTIPDGTYEINTAITLTKGVTLIGNGNPVIHVNTSGHGFIASNIEDIAIKDIEFTAPEDNTAQATHADHHIFKFTDCSYITIDNCKAYYGVMGFTFKNCSNITFTNNIMHHFTGWSNVFGYDVSECDNALIEGNTSYNGSYDGIKLTGYISNIQIINNTCYDNASDGIDFAGQCAKNVIVSGNNISNSTLNGIDFKQLERETYPFDETKEKYFEDITISSNNINNATVHGINSQFYYDDVSLQGIVISNNNIDMKKVLLPSGGTGIRISPCVATLKHAVVIKDNTITASSSETYDFGIRLSDANNILVKSNSVVGTFNSALYLDKQVGATANIDVIGNILINNRTQSNNVINGTNNITNINISDNILQNNYSGYLINTPLYDITTLTLNNNRTLASFTATPTVRVSKNVIYPSLDPVANGCMGWIASVNGVGSVSNMKQYIPIS